MLGHSPGHLSFEIDWATWHKDSGGGGRGQWIMLTFSTLCGQSTYCGLETLILLLEDGTISVHGSDSWYTSRQESSTWWA